MFPLDHVSTDLLPVIFDKMLKEQFLLVPQLNKLMREVYEASVNKFKQRPILHLDMLHRPRFSVEVPWLDEHYANRILKNIQNGTVLLSYFYVNFEEKRAIFTPDVVKDLDIETLVYDIDQDHTALLRNARQSHIFPKNQYIFTMRNKKRLLLLVKLRKYSLSIEEAPWTRRSCWT